MTTNDVWTMQCVTIGGIMTPTDVLASGCLVCHIGGIMTATDDLAGIGRFLAGIGWFLAGIYGLP